MINLFHSSALFRSINEKADSEQVAAKTAEKLIKVSRSDLQKPVFIFLYHSFHTTFCKFYVLLLIAFKAISSKLVSKSMTCTFKDPVGSEKVNR